MCRTSIPNCRLPFPPPPLPPPHPFRSLVTTCCCSPLLHFYTPRRMSSVVPRMSFSMLHWHTRRGAPLVLVALALAASHAAAQVTCKVTERVGCFTDYEQSKRCYPVGPIQVASQASVTLCARCSCPPSHACRIRWNAPRTAPSSPISTRPSSLNPPLRRLAFRPLVTRAQVRRSVFLRHGVRCRRAMHQAAGRTGARTGIIECVKCMLFPPLHSTFFRASALP